MSSIRGCTSAGCCPRHRRDLTVSPRDNVKLDTEQDVMPQTSVYAEHSDDLLIGILECVRSIKAQHEAQHSEVLRLLEAVGRECSPAGFKFGVGSKVPDSTANAREDSSLPTFSAREAPVDSSARQALAPAEVQLDRGLEGPSSAVFHTSGSREGFEKLSEPEDAEEPQVFSVVSGGSPDKRVSERRGSNSSRNSSSRSPARSSTAILSVPKVFSPMDFAFDDEDGGELVVIPPCKDGLVPFIVAVCRFCIRWRYFDHLIGAIILLNSITIGYEAAEEVYGNTYFFIELIEPCFLGIYLLELCMRFVSDGFRANFGQPWVRFDIFLVGLGTVSMAIVEPIKAMTQTEGPGNIWLDALEWIMILRIMRLLRLLRALRLLSQFKTLWRLVQGLMNSLGTMLSTMALLFFVIYVFACIGVELITKDEGLQNHESLDIQELVATNFASLPVVMLTLTQFVTLDSIAGIYSPLIVDKWWMIFYFLPLILIVPVALMNLVTANLVEVAIAMGTDDKEMEKLYMQAFLKHLVPEIHAAFKLVDGDASGIITKDEIEHAADHLPDVFLEKMKGANVVEFFETMDVDGSGEISEEEFVDGVLHFLMSDVPVETQQTMKFLRIIKEKLVLLEEVVFKLPGAPPPKSAHAFHKHDKKPSLGTRFGGAVSAGKSKVM